MNKGSQSNVQAKRFGVIDIGSNSVRFVVYAVHGTAFAPIYDEKVLAGLGRDLRVTGKLSPQGRTQALEALKRFAALAKAQNLDDVLIAATAAMRDADDAREFISLVARETGLDIAPLSGEEEALTSAFGVIAGEPRAHGIAADLGGASLELVQIRNGQAYGGVSHRLGPFAMYSGVFEPTKLRPHIEKKLSGLTQDFANIDTLYLIGGAWRNLAVIDQKRNRYPLKLAYNYSLGADHARELARWAHSPTGIHELLNWPNITQRRADTLPYGGLVLSILLEKFNPQHVVIAPGGLRDGLVYQALIGKTRKTQSPLFDACRHISGDGLASEKHGDFENKNSPSMGSVMYDFLSGIHADLPRTFDLMTENRLRKAASLLVGTGVGLHPDHRAKIVYEIALYGPLPGLTHKERAYLALMLFRSYRSRKTPPDNDVIMHLLDEDERRCAQIYGEAMRASVVLSGRSATALQLFSIAVQNNTLTMSAQAMAQPLIIARSRLHFEELARMIGMKLVVKT